MLTINTWCRAVTKTLIMTGSVSTLLQRYIKIGKLFYCPKTIGMIFYAHAPIIDV
jgi:hypothetical protein